MLRLLQGDCPQGNVCKFRHQPECPSHQKGIANLGVSVRLGVRNNSVVVANTLHLTRAEDNITFC